MASNSSNDDLNNNNNNNDVLKSDRSVDIVSNVESVTRNIDSNVVSNVENVMKNDPIRLHICRYLDLCDVAALMRCSKALHKSIRLVKFKMSKNVLKCLNMSKNVIKISIKCLKTKCKQNVNNTKEIIWS